MDQKILMVSTEVCQSADHYEFTVTTSTFKGSKLALTAAAPWVGCRVANQGVTLRFDSGLGTCLGCGHVRGK